MRKAWLRLDVAIRRAAWGMEPIDLERMLRSPDEVQTRVMATLSYVYKQRRNRRIKAEKALENARGYRENRSSA
jgi:hypothetical protein